MRYERRVSQKARQAKEVGKRANTDGTEEEQREEGEVEEGGEQMQSIVRKMFYKEAPLQPHAAAKGKNSEEPSAKGLENAVVK